MIIHNFEQQSPEWFAFKKGKMGASKADAIANCGAGLKTLCKNIVKDMIVEKEHYTNADIERGNELEPIARLKYEFERGVKVHECGLFEYNDYVVCSPDGYILEEDKIIGGTEIKAKNNDKHLDLLLGGKFDSVNYWQCFMTLLISGAEWWDLCSYNPNFKKSLFVERVYPDEKKFSELLKGFEMGEKLIKEYLENENIINELK